MRCGWLAKKNTLQRAPSAERSMITGLVSINTVPADHISHTRIIKRRACHRVSVPSAPAHASLNAVTLQSLLCRHASGVNLITHRHPSSLLGLHPFRRRTESAGFQSLTIEERAWSIIDYSVSSNTQRTATRTPSLSATLFVGRPTMLSIKVAELGALQMLTDC